MCIGYVLLVYWLFGGCLLVMCLLWNCCVCVIGYLLIIGDVLVVYRLSVDRVLVIVGCVLAMCLLFICYLLVVYCILTGY